MSDTIKFSVDAAALGVVLSALVGQSHLIRELQATRKLPDNPIKKLVEQYNQEVNRHNATKEPTTDAGGSKDAKE